MPFNPRDFYDLAVWLVGTKIDESALRTATGRAYFAVHLLALQKLKAKGWEPTGRGDDHSAVIRYLKRGTTTGLANRMNQLRMFREHADYHLDFSRTATPRDCELCEKAQRASFTAPTVTVDDWGNAKEISERCFPFIDKL